MKCKTYLDFFVLYFAVQCLRKEISFTQSSPLLFGLCNRRRRNVVVISRVRQKTSVVCVSYDTGWWERFSVSALEKKTPSGVNATWAVFFRVFEQSGLFGEYIFYLLYYNIYGLNSFRAGWKRRIYCRFVKTTIAA